MQNGMMCSELVNTKHQSYLKEKAIISIGGNLIQLQLEHKESKRRELSSYKQGKKLFNQCKN